MEKINLALSVARDAQILEAAPDKMLVVYGKNHGGASLEGTVGTKHRYIVGDIELLEDHCIPFMLRFYAAGETEERLVYRFGLLPGVKTRVRFDLDYMDAHTIYTTRTPGMLKLVCHGHRITMDECVKIELGIEDAFHDIKVALSDFYLADEEPSEFPLPDIKLVDEFGQWKPKDWPGKVKSFEELVEVVKANEGPVAYPQSDWDKWGGYLGHKVKEGTGFFSTAKVDGRWYLTDPDGYSYFSHGVCGVGQMHLGDRIDGLEKFCDWLPDREGEYKDFYDERIVQRTPYMPAEHQIMFGFGKANIHRVYGEKAEEQWEQNYNHIMSTLGLNTTGSHPTMGWSAKRYCEVNGLDINTFKVPSVPIPYVQQIGMLYPDTETRIYRDFPDVLSEEYKQNAIPFAEQLRPYKDDPMLIGYFMRNEPEFNFIEDLVIADEVLYNPAQTACRAGLKAWLMERYETIDALNAAWGSSFESFDDFDKSIRDCSKISKACEKDLREYSVFLVREYVRIPAEACRKVDPNHLNLGLRWSKAYNADMCAGWEYCDVFSINCYSFDPSIDMDFAVKAGVDRPILIGEFHFGALDRGLPATGLKGVTNQIERAKAYRSFVEKTAEHPYGVGTHWFQWQDQFCLGRMDGENYQIGLIDVCTRPYPEMADAMKECAKTLYEVRRGAVPAYYEETEHIPMIGY